MIDFEVDPPRARFTMTYSDDYAHEMETVRLGLKDAVAKASRSTGYFDAIVDMTKIDVAPQDRANNGASMIEWCLANGLRRGAFVAESALKTMQLKRLSGRSDQFAFFTSMADAVRWLDEKAREPA